MSANMNSQEYNSQTFSKDKLQNMQSHHSRVKQKPRTKFAKSSRNMHSQPVQTVSSDDSIIFDVPTASFYELSSPESGNEQCDEEYYSRHMTPSQQKSHQYPKMHSTQTENVKNSSYFSHSHDIRSRNSSHSNKEQRMSSNRLSLPVNSNHPQPIPRQKIGDSNRPLSIPSVSSLKLDDSSVVE